MPVLRPFRDRLRSISIVSTETPPSPMSDSSSSPEDESDAPDWALKPHSVLSRSFSRFKPSTFPLRKNLPERSQTPTLPSTPMWERPRPASRSQTAPPAFRRIDRRDSEKEYEGMSEERKAAAQYRVNKMRTYLGLKELEQSTLDKKATVASKANNTQKIAGHEYFEPIITVTVETFSWSEPSPSDEPVCLLPPSHSGGFV